MKLTIINVTIYNKLKFVDISSTLFNSTHVKETTLSSCKSYLKKK